MGENGRFAGQPDPERRLVSRGRCRPSTVVAPDQAELAERLLWSASTSETSTGCGLT